MSRLSSRAKVRIPESFQGVLWSKNIKRLDLEEDKVYIIHQILSYGNLKQIKWLFKVYSSKGIKEIFLKYPKKIYPPPVLYFVKNFILNLGKKKIPLRDYVKTLF